MKTDFWITEEKQYRHGCALRRPAGNKCSQQYINSKIVTKLAVATNCCATNSEAAKRLFM